MKALPSTGCHLTVPFRSWTQTTGSSDRVGGTPEFPAAKVQPLLHLTKAVMPTSNLLLCLVTRVALGSSGILGGHCLLTHRPSPLQAWVIWQSRSEQHFRKPTGSTETLHRGFHKMHRGLLDRSTARRGALTQPDALGRGPSGRVHPVGPVLGHLAVHRLGFGAGGPVLDLEAVVAGQVRHGPHQGALGEGQLGVVAVVEGLARVGAVATAAPTRWGARTAPAKRSPKGHSAGGDGWAYQRTHLRSTSGSTHLGTGDPLGKVQKPPTDSAEHLSSTLRAPLFILYPGWHSLKAWPPLIEMSARVSSCCDTR